MVYKRLTDEQIAEAYGLSQLRKYQRKEFIYDKHNWKNKYKFVPNYQKIAKKIGSTAPTIRRHLEPYYDARLRAYKKVYADGYYSTENERQKRRDAWHRFKQFQKERNLEKLVAVA